MSDTTMSSVPVNPRVAALKEKHKLLSDRIDEARKRVSVSDFYVSDLKKKKLLIKEQIAEETRVS